MPVGPFTEPRGTDCYWSPMWFAILASIIIALDAFGFVCCASEAAASSNKHLRRKFALDALGCAMNICFVATGFASQRYGFLVWALFMFVMLAIVVSAQLFFFRTTMSTVSKVTKLTLVEILGGKLFVGSAVAVFAVAYVIIVVGAVGAAVYGTSTSADGAIDVPLTLAFWQVHCVGWAFLALVLIVQMSIGFGKFAGVIEGVNAAMATMVSNQAQKVEMEDLAKRFRSSSRSMILLGPIGVGLWLLHAFVLPVWWWIVLVHSVNCAAGILFTWWAYAPLSRRARLLPCFVDRDLLLRSQQAHGSAVGVKASQTSSGEGATKRGLSSSVVVAMDAEVSSTEESATKYAGPRSHGGGGL